MNTIQRLRRAWQSFWQWDVEEFHLWKEQPQNELHLLYLCEDAGLSGQRRGRNRAGEQSRHFRGFKL